MAFDDIIERAHLLKLGHIQAGYVSGLQECPKFGIAEPRRRGSIQGQVLQTPAQGREAWPASSGNGALGVSFKVKQLRDSRHAATDQVHRTMAVRRFVENGLDNAETPRLKIS